MQVLIYILTCATSAYLGSRFVVWAIKRSLPVPLGALLLIRFLFWWMLSVSTSFALYALALFVGLSGVNSIWILSPEVDGGVAQFGFLILSIPFWVGLAKGIDLQLSNRVAA